MEIALKGKVAIVTGAGRGIGREIAETLGREGALTVVTDVRPELLDDVADVFRREGWIGRQHICDVRDRTRTQAVVDDVVKTFGRVDVLVNNAGVAPGGPIETLSEESWDLNLDVNLKGTFLMCQAVIPAMKRQRGRSVRSMTSCSPSTTHFGPAGSGFARAITATFFSARATVKALCSWLRASACRPLDAGPKSARRIGSISSGKARPLRQFEMLRGETKSLVRELGTSAANAS